MKKFFNEFKKFAVKGNAIDLAVGVVIGAAFGKITSSLVSDIITPLLSPMLGKVDFAGLNFNFFGATVNYGLFIDALIEFIIIALAIFIVIKQINRLKDKEEKAIPATKNCQFCHSSIHLEAIKCPNCTSNLAESKQS